VVKIGNYVFRGCTTLSSVTIPGSITDIGQLAFENCNGLKNVTIQANSEGRELYLANALFRGCDNLLNVTFAEGVNLVSFRNFVAGCPKIQSISIPASVRYIYGGVFDDMSALTAINVEAGNTVYSSKDGVLFNRDQTVLIRVPEGFSGVYTIPNGVVAIGNKQLFPEGEAENGGAFLGCTKLTGVVFPQSVTTLYTRAFSGCTALKEIEIPENVVNVGMFTFINCTALESVTISNLVPGSAFENCTSLKKVTLINVTEIQSNAFKNCTSLESIDIPASVKNLGYNIGGITGGAFEGCTSLKEVILHEGLERINQNTFQGCTTLESIEIPDSVHFLAGNAFIGRNVTIVANAGSVAATYATDNGYRFVDRHPVPGVPGNTSNNANPNPSNSSNGAPAGEGSLISTTGIGTGASTGNAIASGPSQTTPPRDSVVEQPLSETETPTTGGTTGTEVSLTPIPLGLGFQTVANTVLTIAVGFVALGIFAIGGFIFWRMYRRRIDVK
jgi:hypothetical protein